MKTSRLALLLAGTLAATLIQPTPPLAETPLPQDGTDRQIFMLPLVPEAERARWAAVGAVNGAGITRKIGCTGTLVAPALVLTAAHCVPGAEGGESFGPRRVFVAGLDVGGHVAHRVSSATVQHPAYPVSKGNTRFRYDVALVTLEEPLPPDMVVPIGVAEGEDADRAATQGPLAILGYAKRRPYALSGRFDCARVAGPPGLIYTDCAVVSGNSGAPLLGKIDGTWQVVGVVAGTLGKLGPARSLAVPLPDWARERIAAAQESD
ncbi:trypsin-like peptidase domain-containing protein [Sulfitobacter sp. LCG007]